MSESYAGADVEALDRLLAELRAIPVPELAQLSSTGREALG